MAKKSKKQERRGNVLIDRDLQFRFILRMGGILFFYLLLFLVVSVVAPVAFTLAGEPPEWATMEAAFRIQVLLRIILAPLICTFFCLFAHGVLETFRIAGPSYRFRVVAQDLQKLRVPCGVRVRETDYLKDTVAAFDLGLKAVHEKIEALQALSGRAQTSLTNIKARSDCPEQFVTVERSMRRMNSILSEFTLLSEAPRCEPMRRPPGLDLVSRNVSDTAANKPAGEAHEIVRV